MANSLACFDKIDLDIMHFHQAMQNPDKEELFWVIIK